MVQRGHHYAIVDEVDSILIDEARTPLIISGPASGEANRWFTEFANLANKLIPEVDYEVDEKKRTVGVLEPGIEKVEDYLGIDNLYESANTPLISFLNNSIKAKALFKKDKDYVVMNGEVLIVDEHTGRILAGRRYNEGIHQAIEAKEGVAVKAENQTLATVTLQNYFRLYKKLSGMTGTAETEAAEFMSHLQARCCGHPDQQADAAQRPVRPRLQERAVQVRAGRRRHRRAPREGPARARGNHERREERAALQDARQEGRQARGAQRQEPRPRGRDRRPGRSPRRRHRRHQHGRSWYRRHARRQRRVPRRRPDEREGPQPRRDAGRVRGRSGTPCTSRSRREVETEAAKVVEVGGLYVLGTERHESRRIDNQLRGRSGRQGDPGESRFYLSLQDDLMRLFNSRCRRGAHGPQRVPDDLAIESKIVSRAIRSAQWQVEARNAEIRKNVLKYDDVLNRQREAIYSDRRHILEGDDLQDRVAQVPRRRRSPRSSRCTPPRATPTTGTSTRCGPS